MSQTNFRAEDMPGFRPSGKSESTAPTTQQQTAPAPQQSQVFQPAPTVEPEQDTGPENEPAVESRSPVPDGTAPEVLAWVGDDKERAQQALDKESQSERPRSGLTNELNEIINQ